MRTELCLNLLMSHRNLRTVGDQVLCYWKSKDVYSIPRLQQQLPQIQDLAPHLRHDLEFQLIRTDDNLHIRVVSLGERHRRGVERHNEDARFDEILATLRGVQN